MWSPVSQKALGTLRAGDNAPAPPPGTFKGSREGAIDLLFANENPGQAQRERPDACGHDRAEAWDHRLLKCLKRLIAKSLC